MADPRVLVTGSAVRVGRAILLAFAQAGHNVAVHYRTSEKEAEETAQAARDHGVDAFTVQADLARPGGRNALREALSKRDAALSHLVLSAAIFYPTPLKDLKEEQWDDLMDVNLKAPIFTLQALLPLLADKATVTLIGDTSGEGPWPSYIPYGITKAGIHAATRGLAKALAPKIRVNAIAPGPILPPDSYGDEEKEEAIQRTLLERWGGPHDIAQAVLYLAQADYITGVVLPVDGGRHLG